MYLLSAGCDGRRKKAIGGGGNPESQEMGRQCRTFFTCGPCRPPGEYYGEGEQRTVPDLLRLFLCDAFSRRMSHLELDLEGKRHQQQVHMAKGEFFFNQN